jgi:hypothetical protein
VLAREVLAGTGTGSGVVEQLGWYIDALEAYGVDRATIEGIVASVAEDVAVRDRLEANIADGWSNVVDGDGSASLIVPGAEVSAAARAAVAEAGLDPALVPEVADHHVRVGVPSFVNNAVSLVRQWPLAVVTGALLAVMSVLVDRDRRGAAARLAVRAVVLSVAGVAVIFMSGWLSGRLGGRSVAVEVISLIGRSVVGSLYVTALAGVLLYAVCRWTPSVKARGFHGSIGRGFPAHVIVEASKGATRST